MTELGEQGGVFESRLLRIKFPWMAVKQKRLSLVFVNRTQCEPCEPIRKQTEITSTGNGDLAAKQTGCTYRVFKQAVGMPVSESGGAGDAVRIVVDGKNGGIVGEPQLLQDIECPKGFAGDGITGGAIAKNWLTNDTFQYGFNFAGISTKILRAEVVHFAVPVTVAADIVAMAVDGLHQLGESLGYPADDEKSGLCLVLGKQGKNLFSVAHYSLFHDVPVLWVDNVLKGGNLEIVFHIDGEVVADRVHTKSLGHKGKEVKQRKRRTFSGCIGTQTFPLAPLTSKMSACLMS